MDVAVDGDIGAFGQGCAQRSAELGGKFGGEVDIDHACYAKATKEGAAALVAPNDAILDGGARFDLLARPQLDAGVDDAAFARRHIGR